MLHLHFLSTLFLLLLLHSTRGASPSSPTTLPPDAISLLFFKSSADLDNHLLYNTYTRFDFCQWQGVKCAQGRVIRYSLPSFSLRGTFPAATLSRLDQLRTLSLRNNSLSGPIPDLSGLTNLKTLLLDHNHFSGAFPLSILPLHRITVLDLSYNSLTGAIPGNVTVLDRIACLKLEFNRLSGQIPMLNQTMLKIFNVSGNNLSGPIPVMKTMKRFDLYSFLYNPNLCGNVINKPCRDSPFFNSAAAAAAPPPPLLQQGLSVLSPPAEKKRHNKKVGLVLGLLTGFCILTAVVLSFVALVRKRREEKEEMMEGKEDESPVSNTSKSEKGKGVSVFSESEIVSKSANVAKKEKSGSVLSLENENVNGKLINPDQSRIRVVQSGNLLFCSGEEGSYSLEQLMRASAELLGRGTIGTTYKAVMANQFIVSVKRLDAGKTAITSGEEFEQHMEKVGMLRHPNLVPVRAYFQAKQERLMIFDYQPNGSLFSLVHGSRSTRAKPLHWTSCLKIAEDVAQGLAYIHQASSFIHGNLKSSNVLLGSDFEACITDYCLSTLADTSLDEDPDSIGYKAPEIRKSAHKATAKSDVYAFGVLLLELLTGKPPNQHPFLAPPDMPDWVRAMREDDDEDDTRLRMLVEVASICSLTSPEQRPTMWQVLKMITNIKEIMDDSSREVQIGYS